jgi:hypothetical protein
MNRRIALAVSFVGLNLMACCCGGVAPKQGGPFPAVVKGNAAPIEKPQPELKKTKFNQELVDRYNLKEREFPKLQYYLAADLVLSRELSKEDSKRPQKGKLVQTKGQVIEEIGISSLTPGVCISAETDNKASWLVMSFEEGTKISFRRRAGEDSYTATSDDSGAESKVTYMGGVYTASLASVKAAYVVVGEQSLENFQKNRKDLKGVVLPGQ